MEAEPLSVQEHTWKTYPVVLDGLIALERRVFSKSDSWAGNNGEGFKGECGKRSCTTLVAMVGTRLVGYVVLNVTSLRTHVGKIAVDPDMQRKGEENGCRLRARPGGARRASSPQVSAAGSWRQASSWQSSGDLRWSRSTCLFRTSPRGPCTHLLASDKSRR